MEQKFNPSTIQAFSDLGALALAFGRVNRITCHPDGVTPESDTDHTMMLGLLACAFASRFAPHLDIGKVAQFALVHSARDTCTNIWERSVRDVGDVRRTRRAHA